MNEMRDLRIGVAKQDIAPDHPELFKLWGMPRKVNSRTLRQPLFVEALAVACGTEIVFVVTSDLLFINQSLAIAVRRKVAEQTGCDPMDILFSATHCHSSVYVPEAGDTPDMKTARVVHEHKVVSAFVQACLEARAGLAPAEFAVTSVQLDPPPGACRRIRLSNGTCLNSWNSGTISIPGTKFVGPASPPSRQVDVLCVRRLKETNPFAIMTSYASHIHLNSIPLAHGEVAGGVKQELEARLPGITALYAHSTGGDMTMQAVTPRSTSGNDEEDLAWQGENIRLLARRFADAVVAAVPSLQYHRPDTLYRARYQDRAEFDASPNPRPAPGILIHGVALGDLAILTLQGELFSDYGLELHRRSPFPNLLILGYNEVGYSYLGTPIAYEQGSYELKGLIPKTPQDEADFKQWDFPVFPLGRAELGKEIVDRAIGVLSDLKHQQSASPLKHAL